MFKKFNYNLNHSLVGSMWGISLSIILTIGFALLLPEEGIVPMNQMITIFLSMGMLINFIVATYILFKGEIKQVNVTYVCPTARKYLSEQEISEYEKSVEDEIRKDIEFGEELVNAYKEI